MANIEKGHTKINVERLEKIAEILSLDIMDLLDSKYIVNNFNNKNSSQAIGNVENLYQDNKEITDQLISQLKDENRKLQNEVDGLLSMIESLLKK